jgi:alkylation response protein AidB-like acyl-CoA dehydrogenase
MSRERVTPRSAKASLPDPVAAARDLLPAVRARADEIERLRHLPRDLSDMLAAAGLYRLWAPAEYGGLELPPLPVLETFETLATADGSTAWCVFIAVTSATALARLPPATARAVHASPTTMMAGAFAPRGTAVATGGGYRVDGRWAWGSGIHNADWVLGGCRLMRDGAPETLPSGAPRPLMALAPAADVELLDTWHVSGLCGTGSTDFAMHGVLVPADRIVDLATTPQVSGALYAFPQFTLLAMGIAAVALGLARAAVDELIALAATKTPEGGSRPLAQRPTAQADVARAEASLRSGRAFFHEAVAAAWASAGADGHVDGYVPLAARRDVRLATTNAVSAAVRAVDLCYDLGGGTSVYRRSPLQRIFRDVHTLTQHVMVSPATLELTGRLLFGLETDTSML